MIKTVTFDYKRTQKESVKKTNIRSVNFAVFVWRLYFFIKIFSYHISETSWWQ